MIVIERRFETTPEDVFAVLDDGWAYAGWVVGASTIRAVDANWPQPGSRIHHSVGAWPLLVNDITRSKDYRPGERLVLQAQAWPAGEATVVVEVRPLAGGGGQDGSGSSSGGCIVRMSEDASRGAARLIPRPLRALLVRPRNRESLHRLELLARGRAAGRRR